MTDGPDPRGRFAPQADAVPAERAVPGVLRCAFATLLACAAPSLAWAQPALRPWTGSPAAAPAIELRTVDGRPLALADLAGKVVVVNFWASWCEPCVEEMPAMNRLREKFVGEGFEILAVNFQEGEPRIRNFLLKVPVSFPIVRDTDGAVARAWNVRIFPSSFVVDRNGDTRYALVGPVDWSSRDVEQTLRSLLQAADAGRRPR